MATMSEVCWHLLKEEGNFHVKEGRYSDAIESYTKAILIEHTQPVLYSNRAIAELKLKKFAEARYDIEWAMVLVSLNTNHHVQESLLAKYLRLITEAFLGLGHLKKTLEMCVVALATNPRDMVLSERLAHIQARLASGEKETFNDDEDNFESGMRRIYYQLLPKLIEGINRGEYAHSK
jgi:tetratricopeptide (TPR) repeat protein